MCPNQLLCSPSRRPHPSTTARSTYLSVFTTSRCSPCGRCRKSNSRCLSLFSASHPTHATAVTLNNNFSTTRNSLSSFNTHNSKTCNSPINTPTFKCRSSLVQRSSLTSLYKLTSLTASPCLNPHQSLRRQLNTHSTKSLNAKSETSSQSSPSNQSPKLSQPAAPRKFYKGRRISSAR